MRHLGRAAHKACLPAVDENIAVNHGWAAPRTKLPQRCLSLRSLRRKIAEEARAALRRRLADLRRQRADLHTELQQGHHTRSQVAELWAQLAQVDAEVDSVTDQLEHETARLRARAARRRGADTSSDESEDLQRVLEEQLGEEEVGEGADALGGAAADEGGEPLLAGEEEAGEGADLLAGPAAADPESPPPAQQVPARGPQNAADEVAAMVAAQLAQMAVDTPAQGISHAAPMSGSGAGSS